MDYGLDLDLDFNPSAPLSVSYILRSIYHFNSECVLTIVGKSQVCLV